MRDLNHQELSLPTGGTDVDELPLDIGESLLVYVALPEAPSRRVPAPPVICPVYDPQMF